MSIPTNPIVVYLDQNILSHLREGKVAREDLSALLSKLEKKNPIFVYSRTHVDECRASVRPESFVHVIEELPVYLMEFQNASDQQTALSLGRARKLLLEPEDAAHRAQRMIERLLTVSHYASGWLGDTGVDDLKAEMLGEMSEFWRSALEDVDFDDLGAEMAGQARDVLSNAQDETTTLIRNLPFEQARV